MGLGDVLSQFFFGDEGGKIEWRRTAHIFLFGVAVSGPGLTETSAPYIKFIIIGTDLWTG